MAGSSPPARSLPTVAGYELISELGRGGMGVVYKALQLGLNRLVALKMVLAGAHAGEQQLARFHLEAQAVASLQHVNIVQIYEVGNRDGLPFFSLEFVDGEPLDKKLGGKPQAAREAARLLELLARAMYFAHQHGIVHRDLKPANVLMTASGVPKITDFGLAKRLEDDGQSSQTRTGTIMGTPSYMAPEQARGDIREVGPAADQYALGAVLYELLTGRPPFIAPNHMETIMQVLRNEPVPPTRFQSRVPKDLETICLRTLQKEAHKRYPDCLELAEDLRRFLSGEPIQARPVSTVERAWRWCRRRPLVAGLSALVMSLGVLVLVGAPVAAVKIAVERDAAITARDAAKTAQGLAENAKKLAEQNERKAVVAQRTAAEQRGLALEALGTLVTKVQNQLRETPATQQLKQDLLRTGLEGLRKVAESAQGSNIADAMTAEAHQRMGDIFQSLAQHVEARQQYEQSHTIRIALAGGGPDGADVQRDLALSFAKLGDISLLEGDPKLAYRYYNESLKLREQLAAEQTENTTAQISLATSYIQMGGVSEPEEARTLYERALRIRQSLAAGTTDAARPNRERDVWITFNKLAELSLRLEDISAAREYYDQARGQATTLMGLVPKSARAKTDLALSHTHAGTVRTLLGESEDAKKCFGQALDLLRPLADDDPRNVEIQTSLALVLARHGDHVEAAQKAEQLRNLAPQNYLNLFNVACCYSLCAAAAAGGKSADSLTADEAAAQRRYADQAITTLQQAATCGLRGTEGVVSDHDLDAIRNHPQYPKLLEQLAGAPEGSLSVTSPARP